MNEWMEEEREIRERAERGGEVGDRKGERGKRRKGRGNKTFWKIPPESNTQYLPFPPCIQDFKLRVDPFINISIRHLIVVVHVPPGEKKNVRIPSWES